MRRQDIQLLASARRGDVAARCEAGRRYLCGSDGFRKHIPTALEYLSHSSVKDLPRTARIIAENLPLEQILALGQLSAVEVAAADGSIRAQIKLGAWLCLRHGASSGRRWLESAAAAGSFTARAALDRLVGEPREADALTKALRALSHKGDLDGAALACLAANEALAARNLEELQNCLVVVLGLRPSITADVAELVAGAVQLAEQQGRKLHGIGAEQIELSLDLRATRGDREAAYTLGRAMCGIACGPMHPQDLVATLNMRKGSALLLRAADAGCDAAWLHLYRTNADPRSSVANPGMARFFLEKAAMQDQAEAQRRLGALILRSADSLAESEQAIHWLYQACEQGDAHARQLLESLVLPVEGDEDAADLAIALVRQSDPWLGARLRISRDFGLTKLEALSVDPVEGLRPWGLVIGRNPYIVQARLAAARAVPALAPSALDNLRRAVSLFEQARREATMFEGDLRQRSLHQRRMFARHRLDESLFFAEASTKTLETLRLGPKWAFWAREPLRMALAA